MKDRLLAFGLLGLARVPPALTARALGRVAVQGVELDARSRWLAWLTERAASDQSPPVSQIASIRRRVNQTKELLARNVPTDVRSYDRSADGVAVRVYRPTRSRARAIVYFHGGGWVIGSLESHDGVCRRLASATGAVVIAVDYRLAPEAPFPAAVDDAVAAYRWVVAHRDDLEVDEIAVMGDSAGGNLAAVVCQVCRDAPPAFQVLLYPVTDLTIERPSYALFADGFYLSRERMHWFRDLYTQPGDRSDPRVSPLLGDLSKQPTALVVTAGFDVLRDEGRAYADALREAGNTVELFEYPTLMHGFVNQGELIPTASRAREEIFECIRSLQQDGPFWLPSKGGVRIGKRRIR